MKNTRIRRVVIAWMLCFGLLSSRAQVTTVYDTLNTSVTGGSSQPSTSSNPIYGDTLTLSSGGTLKNFGLTLFNSGSSAGSIFAGSTTVKFYDNTIPYTSGTINNPLLGTAIISWDFTFSPLDPGFFDTQTVDVSGLNIVLPQNVFVTQQFNQTSGSSTRWGVALMSSPLVGSSPSTVFISSSSSPASLYTISGNPGQVGYQIDVAPGGGGNHRPVATPQTLSVNYNASLPITLNGTDADNDFLTYSIATQPANGSLSGSPPNVTYQPNFNFSGADSFTFKANDGQTDSAPATVSITVNPPLAGLIINPIWDSSITSDPNAAAIQNTISNAILVYETKFSDPVTVQITFAEMAGGLGQSSTFISSRSYSTFYNAWVADSKTTNDVLAIAHTPGGSVNPVNGGGSLQLTLPNLRAIGINQSPSGGQSDSTISLNMSIINIDRISINPSKYDLMAVVSHEIDEVLGTSSGLPGSSVTSADLFRFDSSGARTFTTSGDDAWLSFDGGTTRPVRFNQSGGGDYGDFWSTGAHTPRVQDAFGTAGATPNLGVEITWLDVIGWDLVIPAPTPAIQNVTTTGSSINFSWASAPTRGYQVQYKTNLTQASWLNLGSPIVASGPTTSTSDNIGPDPRRFYRVALLPTSVPAPPVDPNPEPDGPVSLVTRSFLPQQAAQMKGQSAISSPSPGIEPASPHQGAVKVQVRAQ